MQGKLTCAAYGTHIVMRKAARSNVCPTDRGIPSASTEVANVSHGRCSNELCGPAFYCG